MRGDGGAGTAGRGEGSVVRSRRLILATAYIATSVSIIVVCGYVLERILEDHSTEDILLGSVAAPVLEEIIKTCLALIPFVLFHYDSSNERPSFLVLIVLVSAAFGMVEFYTDPGEWYVLFLKVMGHVGVSIWIGIVFELFFGYDNRLIFLGLLPSIYLHSLFNALWFIDPWQQLVPIGSLLFALRVIMRYDMTYLWTAKSP